MEGWEGKGGWEGGDEDGGGFCRELWLFFPGWAWLLCCLVAVLVVDRLERDGEANETTSSSRLHTTTLDP